MRTASIVVLLCFVLSPTSAFSESDYEHVDPVLKKPAELKRCVTVYMPAGATKGCNRTDQRLGVGIIQDQPIPKAARETEPSESGKQVSE